MSGILYGVGVGPGDPKLMTYLAVETIKNCPVIAVPADGKEHAISYKIASGIVKDKDQKECLGLSSPMTKDRKILEKNYQKVSEEIIKKLDEGMKGTKADYQSALVSETPLLDVYPYCAEPNVKPEV